MSSFRELGRRVSAGSRRCSRGFALGSAIGVSLSLAGVSEAPAQISFTSAIDLALRNSPRVKMAQDDVDKAVATLEETRDAYLPSVTGSGGLGASTGITLNVPTVFTLSAHSLVFNFSQRDYVRAARLGVQAANLALADVRQQVEEDAALAYLTLDRAQQRQAVMADEYSLAGKLVTIVQDRLAAGVDSEMELKKARRTGVQIRLQQLQMGDEVASVRDHLERLIGLPAAQLTTVTSSVPAGSTIGLPGVSMRSSYPVSAAVLSAETNADSKQRQAFGDSRYSHRPLIEFEAQYGRISPFNDVSRYYNLRGNYNTLSLGVQILLPFIDRAHEAKARGSLAEAHHASHEAGLLRDQLSESRLKLQHGLAELAARVELAELDQGIAQGQLDATLVQLRAGSGDSSAPQMSPKDEQNVRMQERQKALDLLDAKYQLLQSQISLLRQTGEFEGWLRSVVRAEGAEAPKP